MYTPATVSPLLNYFQWSTKTAPNPTLSAPLFPSDTTVYFSTPPYDHAGAIVTGNFLMGVKNNDSYVMTCYIPAGGVAADGLSATVVQGIRLEGLDYTTSDTSLIPAEGFSAGDAIFCNISGIIQALTMGAIRGTIATNGLGFIMGDGTASNATISHLDNVSTKGFLRKNPTTSKVQYSNDGTNWVNIDSVSASNLLQISATDTTPGYGLTKIVAGANISVTQNNIGGNETLSIATSLPVGVAVPATYTPAFLTGDNSAEANFLLWGGTTDGSFAITINGTLRTISAINTVGTASMADIATVIQTAIRTATTALETVTWSTDHFIIASVNTTVSSAITVTSATGSGTDISGAGAFAGLGCDTGHGVVTAAVLNQAADSGKVVLLDTPGKINDQFLNIYSDSQVFTISGTWTKPTGVKFVNVVCIGAGGSGGSGYGAGDGLGGGGGGGGAVTLGTFLASSLNVAETITVGVGGTGVAGKTGAGNNGNNGGISSFGAWIKAGGGGGGLAGQTASAGYGGGGGGSLSSAILATGGSPLPATAMNAISGQGVTATVSTVYNSEYGGATGGYASGAPSTSAGGSSIFAGPGGGAGGFANTGSQTGGGAGGACGSYTVGGGGAASAATEAGGAGSANTATKIGYCGTAGGGGGGANVGTTVGGAGGAGGIPGAGGGGGGPSKGGTSGASGAGGRGEVRIYSW
jgi:hypothetical protein